ncbi:MAG: hypothetical protein ACK4QW_17740 [Alphaproteobacteria bacterium]
MRREQWERHQVWIYLAAIALGLAIGTAFPATAGTFDTLLWPALAVLLYATFAQVHKQVRKPLTRFGAVPPARQGGRSGGGPV